MRVDALRKLKLASWRLDAHRRVRLEKHSNGGLEASTMASLLLLPLLLVSECRGARRHQVRQFEAAARVSDDHIRVCLCQRGRLVHASSTVCVPCVGHQLAQGRHRAVMVFPANTKVEVVPGTARRRRCIDDRRQGGSSGGDRNRSGGRGSDIGSGGDGTAKVRSGRAASNSIKWRRNRSRCSGCSSSSSLPYNSYSMPCNALNVLVLKFARGSCSGCREG